MLLYLHEMQINLNKKPNNRLEVVLAEQGKTKNCLQKNLTKMKPLFQDGVLMKFNPLLTVS